LMIIASPGRSSKTNPVMRAFPAQFEPSGILTRGEVVECLFEQVQQRRRRLIGDRKRLRAQLLANLQRLKLC